MAFVSRHWTSSDRLRLHARDYAPPGDEARLPVICLHGLTRNARDFDVLAPWIAARGRRVIAADVRGRGSSAHDPEARYHLPVYADDVMRMAEALGISSAVFIGTSMGGLITMEVAAVAPDLIAATVINDVGPELGAAGLRRIGGYVGNAPRFTTWAEAAAYLAKVNAAIMPDYRIDDWDRMARRMFRAETGGIVPDYDPAIAAAFATAPTAADPWERWRGLVTGRPVLLLRGALSDLLEAEAAERMVARNDAVRLCEVPGVGHAPMLDEPAALAAIGGFLEAVR